MAMHTFREQLAKEMAVFAWGRRTSASAPDGRANCPQADVSDGDPLNVVIPVSATELCIYTFKWYLQNLHRPDYNVHIIHVPEVHLPSLDIANAGTILKALQDANGVAATLKVDFEFFLETLGVSGQFVRVAANHKWSAVVNYAKRVKALMIVMGSENLSPQAVDFVAPTAGTGLVANRSSLTVGSQGPRNPSPATAAGIGVTNDVITHTEVPVVVVRMPTGLN